MKFDPYKHARSVLRLGEKGVATLATAVTRLLEKGAAVLRALWHGLIALGHRHEFKGAVFVASVVVVLDGFHLLDRWKVAAFNATAAVAVLRSVVDQSDISDVSDTSPPDGPLLDSTLFVRIDQHAYETEFNQSSPLDRTKLAQLLETIVASKYTPAVVALDLDLSPNPVDDVKDKQGDVSQGSDSEAPPPLTPDRRLAQALDSLARNGARVVLMVPEPVETPGVIDRKANWMTARQQERIRFGLGTIFSLDGTVGMYLDAPSTFAGVMCQAALEAWPSRREASSPSRTENDCHSEKATGRIAKLSKAQPDCILLSAPWTDHDPSPCGGISSGDRAHLMVNRNWLGAALRLAPLEKLAHPINFSDSIPLIEGNTVDYARFLAATDDYLKTTGLLLIGGDYGTTDRYRVPGGELAGSEIHLAAFLSMSNAVDNHDHTVRAYLFEIVAGLGVGFLLTWLRAKPPHILLVSLGVAALFVVSAALVALSTIALIRWNLWMNPAPVIVGNVLHSMLPWHDRADHHSTSSDRWIRCSLFCVAIVCALILLFLNR